MLVIQGKLVSDELLSEAFVCNLEACKGACCWEGDYGAPLEADELKILEKILPEIEPFLSIEGKRVLAEQGPYVYTNDLRVHSTPLQVDGACAYLTFDQNGVAKCGIEKAWEAGAIAFRKPISCHLYPVRIKRNPQVDFEALNYDRWDICAAACDLGKKLKVPVFKFIREALVRKYGQDFYEELEAASKHQAQEKT